MSYSINLTGKIIGERFELRTRAKELSAVINEIVREVNSLPIEDQKRVVNENWYSSPHNRERLKF
jgi:hypothetical protein